MKTNTRRQRPDGTWTYSTPEWDARWYWPLGTAVIVAGRAGVIVKANSVTVSIRTADGTIYPRVPVTALTRAE